MISTTRRYLHADPRGSIVAVTNGSGTSTATNTYDEFGIPGEDNEGRFQYTGQVWIPEIGMYYYKARMYSPTLGRFMQTDPIGYGDGLNIYNYVGGDPVNAVDPTGLCTKRTTTTFYDENENGVLDEGEVIVSEEVSYLGCNTGGANGGAGGSSSGGGPLANYRAERQRRDENESEACRADREALEALAGDLPRSVSGINSWDSVSALRAARNHHSDNQLQGQVIQYSGNAVAGTNVSYGITRTQAPRLPANPRPLATAAFGVIAGQIGSFANNHYGDIVAAIDARIAYLQNCP